jgi:hypothetical protein
MSKCRGRTLLCRLALAIALTMTGAPPSLLADPALAADRFEPIGGGWQLYVNERFGTSLAYPADIFAPADPPENGDGRRFLASDAALEVYAWNNIDDETAASLKRRLRGSAGYERVTYSPSGADWLVLSGFRGRNIFYEKYVFDGAAVHGFGIEFPAAAKSRYAPIIERIEDSFAGRPR